MGAGGMRWVSVDVGCWAAPIHEAIALTFQRDGPGGDKRGFSASGTVRGTGLGTLDVTGHVDRDGCGSFAFGDRNRNPSSPTSTILPLPHLSTTMFAPLVRGRLVEPVEPCRAGGTRVKSIHHVVTPGPHSPGHLGDRRSIADSARRRVSSFYSFSV